MATTCRRCSQTPACCRPHSAGCRYGPDSGASTPASASTAARSSPSSTGSPSMSPTLWGSAGAAAASCSSWAASASAGKAGAESHSLRAASGLPAGAVALCAEGLHQAYDCVVGEDSDQTTRGI